MEAVHANEVGGAKKQCWERFKGHVGQVSGGVVL